MITKKIIMTLCAFLAAFAVSVSAQTVSGTVSDESGPLVGASVTVKGSNAAAATDADGHYTIKASEGNTLVFSYVGYDTAERRVGRDKTVNVTLKENIQAIDEVVVTAIGLRQQKKKLGYTTQQVTGETLSSTPQMNVGSALTGQVAGLTIANPTGIFQAPSIKLRGNAPLVVLDGVPVETDFYDISSDNIESINVLKGTAAAALYGSRGKNGAILITSKSAAKKGVEVTFSTNNMVTAGFAVLPETQHEYGSGSNGKYEFWDGADGGISDGDMTWGPKLNAGLKIAQWNSPIRNRQTGEIIPWWGDVKGTQYDDKSLYERVPTDWVSHDNLNDFLQTGFVTSNNLSVAYKGEKSRIFLTTQYAYQKGQVPSTRLQNGGLNLNSSFDLSDRLTLDANLGYNKVLSPSYPRYGYGPRNHMYTIVVWMGDDVNGRDLRDHLYVPGQEGYRQANYNYAWYNNPYFAATELKQSEERDVTNANLRLNYELFPGLNLQLRGAMRNNIALATMKSPKTYMNYGDSRAGDYKVWNTRKSNYDTDFLLSYTRDLAPGLLLTANGGGSMFYRTYRQEYQSTDGLIVPWVYSINNSQGPVMATAYREAKSIRSLYATVNLDLWKYAYLTLSGRNDWSSTLATGYNSYFYPAVSLSSMVSDYVKLPSFMDFLKVYGSWASVSTDMSPYEIMATYSKGTSWGSTQSVSYPGSLVNPYIKPQKTTSTEAGISTSFLNSRIGIDVTYYHSIDENQIINLSLSQASGFDSRKVNGNKYTSNGLEIMLNTKPVVTRDFAWTSNLNWSTHEKRLTEIYGGAQTYGDYKLGDRVDAFYGSQWMKSADGQVILDKNGMPTKDAFKRYMGHLDPKFRFGWQNSFRYGDFTLDVDMDGAWKGVIYSVLSEKLWWGGRHPESVEYRDAQYTAGKPVYVPEGVVVTGGELKRDASGNVISDTRTYAPNTTAVDWQQWCQNFPYKAYVTTEESAKFANVFDRTFVKLRRVQLTYDFTSLIGKRGPVKGLKGSIYGNNLAVWKKVPFVDPDFTGDSNDGGANDPTARYVGFGLNVNF